MSATRYRRTICVGIDGTESARHAAKWAAETAASKDESLSLLCSIDMPESLFYSAWEDYVNDMVGRVEKELATLREELVASYPKVDVSTHVRTGNPVVALLEESREAALVVVGSRQDDRAGQLVPTSAVAVDLVAHGECPVAVIRHGRSTELPPVHGPVVVGVDRSPMSATALAVAFDEASRRKTEIVAVHGLLESNYPKYVLDDDSESAVDWGPIRAREERALIEQLSSWRAKYPEVSVRRVVTLATPESALMSQAESAQLLVVGSRGRGGFPGKRIGSTSRRLISNAPCPLIVAGPYA